MTHHWVWRLVVTTLNLLLILAPLPIQASTLLTQALFQPLLLGASDYTEGWENFFYFDDGSLLVTHFMVSNMGPGYHRGIMVSTLSTADGHTYVIKNGRKRKQWSGVSGPHRFGVAKHYIGEAENEYRIHLENSTAEIDINFSAVGVPWQGKRVTLPGDNGNLYQDLMFYAPYLTATGRYRPGSKSGGEEDEAWRPLTGGQGFALRYVTGTGIHNLATHRLRLTTLGTASQRLTADLIKTPDGQWHPRMAIWAEGQLQHQFDAVKLEPFWPNEHLSQAKDIPRGFHISATDGDTRLSGTLYLSQLLHRFDVLANMTLLDRLFLGAFSAPVQSRYRADYQLRLSHNGHSRTLDGQALVEYVQINPR
ncbi:MAG: hypothetical protein GXP09_02730 [Gammaproteobacteria bacterium]|nr:hypothetical protein [Gammaproteobacteria bacterium]